MKSIAGKPKTINLFLEPALSNYLKSCSNPLLKLTNNQPWINLITPSTLKITAPNSITIPGQYHFHLNSWQINLTVEGPCYLTKIVELE
jgi:hypothetical protein